MCTDYVDHTDTCMPALMGRRGFLRSAAAAALAGAAAVALPDAAVAAVRQTATDPLPATATRKVKPAKISIQLYTMRQAMSEDLDATFAALSAIGYRRVEHAGFNGLSAEEFKAALDKHGLHATSGHTNIPFPYNPARWQQVIEDALVLGQRAIVEPLPYMAAVGFTGLTSVPTAMWQRYADALNQAGAAAAEHGISVGYHNHNVEFVPVVDNPSVRPYDILLAETDPSLVHFELDLYWAWKAQQDPVELIAGHEPRIQRFHVKDMDTDGNFADPGKGVIDFSRIFAEAGRKGIRDYIVERDDAGENAVRTARRGYRFLHGIRF